MSVYSEKINNVLSQISFLKTITELSGKRGEKVFIVGGFVRDIILNRVRDEIDFLVLGNGVDFAENLAAELKVENVSVFKNFGTAHFRYESFDLEFVGARKESYSESSRNPIVTDGTFEDDINRRDFTINSIAVSLSVENFGEVIDIFNGLQDIENKIIKTPLDPEVTFNDDPLRIMRAFRFASQLNFLISDDVLSAASNLKERLKIISQERITDEFLKILKSEKPSYGLNLLQDSGVMEVIFPEISNLAGVDQRKDYHHKDVFLHTLQVLDNISAETNNVWLRLAALLHDVAKPPTKKFIEGIGWTFHGHEDLGAKMAKAIFKRMKLPFVQLEYIQKLIRLHLRPIALVDDEVTDSAIRRFVVASGEDLEDLIKLCRADITSKNINKVSRYLNNYEIVMQKVREVKEKDKLREFQSPVRGEEIMKEFNLKPGKVVGQIKTEIEEAILEGIIANDYDEAHKFMMQLKSKYLSEK